MATSVDSVVDRVAQTLIDPDFTRWTLGEHLEWLNEGQREIAHLAAGSCPVRVEHPLDAGSYQRLPDNAIRLVAVHENVSSGRVPTLCERSALDVLVPDWRTREGEDVVNYIYDASEPRDLYIVPGQPAQTTNKLALTYDILPEDVGSGDDIAVRDEYAPALVDYVLSRAYAKDTEDSSPDLVRAQMYAKSFVAKTAVPA